ncbi:MAG: two-component regulator propeller domain-containing protein, partial [Candidatus Cryptobacteroides sp.]
MKRILIIACLALSAIGTSGADLSVSFNNVLLPETGAAYCMQKDKDGLLWIGTGDGLFCYDGYRYYHKRGFMPDAPYGVQAMAIMADIIYLGCDNGLYKYDIPTNKFECLISEICEINAIHQYGNIIYIGCKEGLWIWDMETKTGKCKSEDIKSVYAFAEYGESMLVGTLDGLYLLKNGRIFKRSYSDYVGVILQDVNEGYFWIGVEGNLFYYDAAEDRLQPTLDLTGNYVKCLAFDAHSNLYIGTDNGLYIRDEDKIRLYRHDSGNHSSIQNNIICDIYIDSEQNVWLGNNVGFSMIPYMSLCEIVPIRNLTNSTEGSLIHAISLDGSGNLWFGGTDGLIHCYDSKNGRCSDWYKQSSKSFPILHNRIRDIYNDRDGDVWILTDHGINLYDKDSRQLINFIVKEMNSDYSCTWAYDMYMDENRNLWIAAFNEGLFVVNKDVLIESGGACNADVFYGKSNGKLAGEHVYHIIPAVDGRIWISSNGGIDMIDPASRTVKHVSEESATSMLLDNEGRVWTAFINGLRCYDAL